MTHLISTHSGSTYQLDAEAGRIRRLSGSHAPTERQGPDGEWRTFADCSDPAVGRQLVIVWSTDADGVARCTVTSTIVAIESTS
jgi:hypothetical protein